jgi:hypothetical protein
MTLPLFIFAVLPVELGEFPTVVGKIIGDSYKGSHGAAVLGT